MSIELPESIRNCQPCQEKAITGTLLTVCELNEELKSELDCKGLAEKIQKGEITSQEVIELIAEKSQGTEVEETVDQIINILED